MSNMSNELSIEYAKEKVKELQKVMKLEHWKIDLEQTNDDVYGKVFYLNEQYRATIYINLSENKDERELINTILHEMIHIHDRDRKVFIDDLLEDTDSNSAKKQLMTNYRHINERFTDALAGILEDLYFKVKDDEGDKNGI